jgi:hypothetical protein
MLTNRQDLHEKFACKVYYMLHMFKSLGVGY